jgi:ribokinase
MGNVIVLGSLITDLVARAPRLPAPGETVLGDDFAVFLGGKGFNQAVAAARQGARVALIGQVGADAYGDAFFPALGEEGIESAHVDRDPQAGTGVSLVLVGAASGQNMIVASPRANLTLTVAQVEAALDVLLAPAATRGGVFLAQCETSVATVRAGLRRARDARLTTLLNVAPIPREPLDDALFALVDVLIVNETEAAALAGMAVESPESAREASTRLLARGPRTIVLTLGAQGYLASERLKDGAMSHQHQPAFLVPAVDATAAGDAFCGALAASLAEGLPLPLGLRRANAAGAIAVSRRGALPSLPTAAEVDALLATQG